MDYQLIELYLSGLTVNQIAKQTGIYNHKIKRILVKEGVFGDVIKEDTLAKHHDEIVRLYAEHDNYKKVAEILNISRSTLVIYCKKYNLYKRKEVEMTDTLESEILRLYEEGVSSPKIAKQLGVSKWTVLHKIPQEEKKKKQFYNTYECNYSFFDNIDNEVKAYFLGLFYADGYNCEEKTYIRLGFAEKDSELLYKFKEAINSNHPIAVRERKNKNAKHQDFYSLTICSKVLSDTLVKHGCVQAKTHVLDHLPEMEESLLRHFIRGYFDGDGSVWHSLASRGEGLNLSLTGNKPFLLEVQKVLVRNLEVGSPKVYIRHKEREGQIGDLRYAHASARKILEWLYNDCQYYSERKKSIYLKEKFEEELI